MGPQFAMRVEKSLYAPALVFRVLAFDELQNFFAAARVKMGHLLAHAVGHVAFHAAPADDAGITEYRRHALQGESIFNRFGPERFVAECDEDQPFEAAAVVVAHAFGKRFGIAAGLRGVADQGIGFDWRSLPDPKEKSNLLNRNGRGIMMARYAFDEMIYNDTGNEVTLVVNLDVPYRGRRT